jgi:hypothetical protein
MRNLLLARRSPELMNMLLAQRAQYSPKTVAPQEEQSGYTNLQLLEKLGNRCGNGVWLAFLL